jgi:glycosyltransferase involved in cell wall biosynthesis
MNKPLVTVLMPAFNAGKYIEEAIASVLRQTFTSFELLIINDGSTDNTVQVIRSFKDDRIVLIDQSNQGIAHALNNGIAHAKAGYIARLDADDICYPGRLEKQYSFLNENHGYVALGSDAEYISENGEYLCDFKCIGYTHEEISHSIYTHCPFLHSAVMFRKEAVLQCGGYPALAHNFEDHLLWIQLSKHGQFCNLPEALIKYRFNAASVTIDEKWRGKHFGTLKSSIIRKGSITKEEGDILLSIVKKQDTRRIKEGAYHALCGKKFLVNNHQPGKARDHISRSIRVNPYRLDNYVLFILSYFPQTFIQWLHQKNLNRL